MASKPDRLTHSQLQSGPFRIPLGRTPRRLSYERRIRIWLTGLALPSIILAAVLVYDLDSSLPIAIIIAAVLAVLWLLAAGYLFEQLTRPLQTLSNVVAALRDDDFSFRARGARRGDSLGDLALEINALAATLQQQRSSAQDALMLVERVMTSMQSPVLAFDSAGDLRLLNAAAERVFGMSGRKAIGRSARDLNLLELLTLEDEDIYSAASFGNASGDIRWSVRRTAFRLFGVPHTLLVLSDVAAALREEERLAWQRLIRVLSHEINNSLTPIKSLAGSLRTRLPELAAATETTIPDFRRALTIIEDRAASLNRFLQAYQQLTRLPPATPQRLSLRPLVEQVIHLEARLHVLLQPGPEIHLPGDPDQLQQLLINLVWNAVEAALSVKTNPDAEPSVTVTWSRSESQALVFIRDNGPGLGNSANLFVPFYTTKPEGSGIGLVLAQQIAAAHKGAVTLVNNDGAPGCTATLRLPIEQE